MGKKKIPIVAIVGRANVGKSSLFNVMLGKREAIVAKEAGTTRDTVWQLLRHKEHDFWLVDTAGMKTAEDEFELTIQEQINQATDDADIILVVAEAPAGVSQEDRRVAKIAHKSKKPVILVINKIDRSKDTEIEEFLKLGIDTHIHTSTTQKRGISELLDTIVQGLPKTARQQGESDQIDVALLGRPNVGKSSLFNALLKKQEAIVSDVAGTTRDINRRIVRYHDTPIAVSDTAGIRRSGKIERGVEQFSVLRSLSAIENADICLLLIDASEPSVQLDQKIAGMIKDATKGLILVVSKWDELDKTAYTRDIMAKRLQQEFSFVPWAPLVFTSSVSGQNVSKIFDLIIDIHQKQQTLIKTSTLNNWLKKITRQHAPAGLKNYQPNLKYIVQESDNPTNFKVYGSHTKYLHWSYKRYMDRELREAFGFEGTAVRFWFFDSALDRKKNKRKDT